MALAFVAVTEDKASGGSVSFSHNATGANVLYVIVSHRNASGVTGVTYAGVAMTQIAYNDPGNNLVTQKVFRLVSPTTGANNVVLSPVGAVPNRVTCTAISFSGADTTTPNGTPVLTSGGPVTTATSSVTSATGEIVVEAFAIMEDTAAAATLTEGAGQTQRGTDQEQVSGGSGLIGAVTTEAGAASVTSSWTISAASNYVHTIFSVHASGGDTTAPAPATVTADESPLGTAIALAITMPADADLSQYEVRRLTSDFPANDRSNGTIIVAATATTPSALVNFSDTGLTNGLRYYYRVFLKDATGNWNTGTTISEVAASAMTVVGWYTSAGTFKADGETGANPIFEWTVSTANVEASKPVPFRFAVGSDNPGPNLEPTQNVNEYVSTDASTFTANNFRYFSGGNWVTVPVLGVPWASVNAGTVTCRYYSFLNANQNLYGVVRPEQA